MATRPRISTARTRARTVVRATLDAITALSKSDDRAFMAAIALLKRRKGKILFSGVGKSAAVATKAAATFTSLGHPAFVLDPLAALHGDSGMVGSGDVLIAISFSGASTELVKAAKHVRRISKSKIIVLTHGSHSPLAELASLVIDIPVAHEGSPHELAPMASTTASVVITDMLAAALTEPTHFTPSSFAAFHPGGSLGLTLSTVASVMRPRTKTPRILVSETFTHALEVMTEHGRGVVAVVDRHEQLMGIITDGDVRRILMKYDSPKELPVKKLMKRGPKTISENKSLKEALAFIEQYKITSLFVTRGRRELVGMLHLHDIVERGL